MSSILSKNIRYLRKSRRMSQSALANKLNRSESAIQMWETDMRSPTMEMVQKISEVFDINLNTLVYTDLETGEYSNTGTTEIQINNVEEAMQYILRMPVVSAYGGYDLDKMSDEEIIQFANKLTGVFKMLAEEYKK